MSLGEAFPAAWFADALDAMIDPIGIQRAVRDARGDIVDFEVLYTNRVDVEVAGRAHHQLTGGRLSDLYSDAEIGETISLFAKVVETGESVLVEERPFRATIRGQLRTRLLHVHRHEVRRRRAWSSPRNATEQRESRRRLEDTNRKFEAAQQLAQIGVWAIDFEGGTATASDELARIFGFEQGGEVQWHAGMIIDAIHPDDRARVQQRDRRRPAQRRQDRGRGSRAEARRRAAHHRGPRPDQLRRGRRADRRLGHGSGRHRATPRRARAGRDLVRAGAASR